MLKLMKYEFRKMRMTLLIMLAVLAAIEAGYVIGVMTEHDFLPGLCLLFLFILTTVVYIYLLISGIVSYSRELKDRTGYLIFMTPVRPISIVFSKLLFTVIAAIAAAVLFGGCTLLNFMHQMEAFDFTRADWAELSISFRVAFADAGMTLTQVVLTVVYLVLEVLIEMISVLCTAYLAITLSATVMSSRRGFLRGLVSFALFTGLTYLTGWLGGKLLTPEKVSDFDALLKLLGMSLLLNTAVSGVFAFASAALLKRRVSL